MRRRAIVVLGLLGATLAAQAKWYPLLSQPDGDSKIHNEGRKTLKRQARLTTRNLFFVRHASAEIPDAPSDFERPLDQNGKKQVDWIRKYFKSNKVTRKSKPDIVVLSPSARTRETILPVVEQLKWNTSPERLVRDKKMYKSSQRYILRTVIPQLPEDSTSAVLVGHNPEFQDSINQLVKDSDKTTNQQLKVKKGCVSWFKLSGDSWGDSQVEFVEMKCPKTKSKRTNH
eukprot:TRINITY_DN9152_c0_g1_i1.p1 TRINITY_DN9152_c0_g1~~TRINITY_DN9152_c0_g1_i1.p1  ORF type:complete len:229 (+),score=35.80 TRINITY_DN9152_c0_g1_i1:44-730(+)